MEAALGDRILVESRKVVGVRKAGEVVEVIGVRRAPLSGSLG